MYLLPTPSSTTQKPCLFFCVPSLCEWYVGLSTWLGQKPGCHLRLHLLPSLLLISQVRGSANGYWGQIRLQTYEPRMAFTFLSGRLKQANVCICGRDPMWPAKPKCLLLDPLQQSSATLGARSAILSRSASPISPPSIASLAVSFFLSPLPPWISPALF